MSELDFNLDLTGLDPGEIDGLPAIPDEERANAAPPLPANPVSQVGDLLLRGEHRVLCGDATSADDVARLLGDRQPLLMVTDPPYGIELDSEWSVTAPASILHPARSARLRRKQRLETTRNIRPSRAT